VCVVDQLAYEVITNEEAIEPIPNVEAMLRADSFGTSEHKSFKQESPELTNRAEKIGRLALATA
jgi:hypothetical protein